MSVKFKVNQEVEILDHGSVSFLDPEHPLDLELTSSKLKPSKLVFHFVLEEKVNKAKDDVPLAGQLDETTVEIKVPVDKERKGTGATYRPVTFDGLTSNGKLMLHFNITNAQTSHYVLGYTFYWQPVSEKGKKNDGKK